MRIRRALCLSDKRRSRRGVRGAAIVAASLLLAASLDARAAISFGTRSIIWSFLFAADGGRQPAYSADEKMKLEVALGNLDRYAEVGARWNIVDVWQEVDGPDGFRRLDRVVAEHEGRGIQPALRLLERPEIYDAIGNGGDTAASALREYREWTGQMARRYGARVRYYMISNEADHDIGYNRPVYRAFRPVIVEEYRELLRAAYGSIHAVDPRLTVADQGVSSYSLALAVMADLVLGGRSGDALTFWRAMDYTEPQEGERSLVRLLARLGGTESRRRIEYARRSTAELTPYRDVYQLHHYYGPATVPAVLAWVRGQMVRAAGLQPVVAAEVGYLIPAKRGKSWDGRPINVADMASYSDIRHGSSVAESIAALAGNGVEDILYWDMRFHVPVATAASLFPATTSRDDFRPSYPADVFRFVVQELAGASPVAASPGPGAGGLVEYRFRRGGDFSVLWPAGGGSVTIPPALRGRIERMSDAAGRPISSAGPDGDAGTAPVFVYWQPQAVAP